MAKIQTKKRHLVGILFAFLIILVDIMYFPFTPWFTPLIVVAITVAWLQYWVDFFIENNRQKQIENNFPDFVRNLVSAVKSGMPVSRAIVHVANTNYGPLTPYVKKLGNQVDWGIPLHKAFLIFSDSTDNNIIKRAISTMIEAETSGGNIEDVLDSITDSLVEIKKIKEKRKAAVFSQVVQSYVIFIVFLGVIVVIQNMLIPYVFELQDTGGEPSLIFQHAVTVVQKVSLDFSSLPNLVTSLSEWFFSLNGLFLMLSVIQAFFAGIVIGILSEGNLKDGLKHSLILVTVAFFVMSLAQGF